MDDTEKISQMMIRCGLATGHGGTIDDLIFELEKQIKNTSNAFSDARKQIERLRTVAVKRGLWKEAPCCVCGYNGPNYFQPSVHKCAAIEENE
jgi:hypothetical protein